MSKSKGNFYTLRNLLAKGYDPMAIRYALLSTHYRTPLNFTLEGLKESAEAIKRFDDCYFQCISLRDTRNLPTQSSGLDKKLELILEQISESLSNDLNIAKALALIFDGVKEINTIIPRSEVGTTDAAAGIHFFQKLDRLFGFDVTSVKKIPGEIIERLLERHEIRMRHDFKNDKNLQTRSDELRNEMAAAGWLVKDTKPGQSEMSTVKKKRRAWD